MKRSMLSFITIRMCIVVLFILFLNSFSYSQDILEITGNYEQNVMNFNYTFIFDDGSPSSIIAIEKPKDSILINAIDSLGNEYEPLVIGDFYRFEIEERDINRFEVIFTSASMYNDIFKNNELALYVNTNLDVDGVNVNLDVVKDFNDVNEIFPRNYEYNKSSNRIKISQSGILDDNLFRITYSETNSDLSFWLVILLFIPIAFFLILFAVLKVKPYSRDKKLDEYISNDNSDSTNNDSKSKQTIKVSSTNTSSMNSTDDGNNENDSFVYSYEDEKTSKDDIKESTKQLSLNTSQKENKNLESSVKRVEREDEINGNTTSSHSCIKNEELEEYITKYFTENEQDVIRTIHNKEGIVQQEILDVLSIFTKSTLSKILTKLENRKMIERVRVGKINKLYIGEKLKTLISDEKEKE
ncbi:MAG: helix-turn-helix transcriptional regulator [Candidatus Nanoarchaeia archaeon]